MSEHRFVVANAIPLCRGGMAFLQDGRSRGRDFSKARTRVERILLLPWGWPAGMIRGILISPEPEPAQETSSWKPKLLGALLILAVIALAASLVSYKVQEMGWAFLNPRDAAAASARPCTNLLGVPGLYLAGLLYAAFGAVAYYLLFLLAIESFVSLFASPRRRLLPAMAMLFMLACALAVADIQPWLLRPWVEELGLRGAGGALGYLYGSCVLEVLLGTIWALVLLIAIHGAALIYFGRTTPAGVCRELWYLIRTAWVGVKEWFARRAARRATQWKTKQQAALAEQEELSEELREPEHPRRLTLPSLASAKREAPAPRLRSAAGAEVSPMLPGYQEDEAEEGHTLPPSFEEREERVREEESRRIHVQPAPSFRDRMGPGPHRRSGDNLLDLMPEVEKKIELGDLRPFPTPSSPRPTPPAPRPAPPAQDPRDMHADYPLPPYELLSYEPVSARHNEEAEQEMRDMQQRIITTLEQFRIPVEPGDITRGPSITRYEFYPPQGLLVSRIQKLSNNLMLSTCSESVNILAPIPGKDTIGIELANAVKTPVYLRELLQDAAFRSPKLRIPVALGKDVYGHTVIGDLAAMPHTLVAGTTGSGKSVCINSMIISMLYKFRPDELKLILVDPKVVEMQPYKSLPHLACPVVTNPGRVISALRWAVNEMEHRYKLFSKISVRNFEDYNRYACEYDPEADAPAIDESAEVDYELNERIASEIERDSENEVPLGEEEQGEFDFDDDNNIPLRLPYIVIIIDELADLMMMVKEDLETYVARLTQKARAAGIHLVVATQTPRSNVVTGMIKANIPSRLAFKVASQLDSRIILETPGAENLLGQGDFLFLPPGGVTRMRRAQGAFVSDAEVAMVVKHCARHARQNFEAGVMTEMENGDGAPNGDNGGRITGKGGNDEEDELYTRCVSLVVSERKASTSLLQRRFSIGYGRAAKIMDLMEQRGVISPPQGATRAREVLVDAP